MYDITLRFFLQTPEKEGEVEAKEVARVRMSPQQAKALHILLQRHLRAYGEQFQEIFLPDEMVTRLVGEEEGEEEEGEDGN